MPKNAGQRSTETLYLRVSPTVRYLVIEAAGRLGLSVSAYIAGLVVSGDPAPKLGIDLAPLVILGHRCIAALDELPDRIEARAAVAALRCAIVEQLLKRRPEYVTQVERRGAPCWD
jgi:hypothetical protein